MKTRFLLKRRGNTKGSTHPIFVALYEGEQTEIIFTGQRIGRKDWSESDRLPKDQTGEVYKSIEQVKTAVIKTITRLQANEQPITPFIVKQAYISFTKEKKKTQYDGDKKAKAGLKMVHGLARNYIETLPSQFKKNTQKTVKSSINSFLQYLEKTGKRSLEIKDFSNEIIEDYGKFLMNRKNPLADSSINKNLKHLKWFLKSVKFDAVITPRKLKKKAIIALTVPELRALEAVDVTTHKDKASHEYFQRAKDMFLLGCYSALRISDLKRLNPANTSDGFISLTTQKNNEIFRMPIVSQAKAILEKYRGRAPKISEQEVNRSIKKVCELAKINKPVEIEGSRGGKSFTKIVPKHELITSHIAGKTFITNAKELWGLEPAEIAGIVRKDLKTLLNHYFKAPVESATLKMLNADKAQMKVA